MNRFVKIVLGLMVFALSTQTFAIGAIAIDDEEGNSANDIGYGLGFGDSKESASREALRKCRAAGNTNCAVKVWFESCGAYAVSRRYYGVGWGRDIETAERNALKQCNNSACKIAVSECDD